jgi:hypothetical protein
MDKKLVAIEKDMYKVEDGKVYIESAELANAIQNEGLELFVDEEAAAIQALCDCC